MPRVKAHSCPAYRRCGSMKHEGPESQILSQVSGNRPVVRNQYISPKPLHANKIYAQQFAGKPLTE